ncbi:DUF2752 domain-containing protein [Streptomyces sp. NPDC017979]|uniref:DUF2752 domain-containing protein n=1 Tax=unclassified Streptomyces TaxID=2593676 RepID=UPI0037914426
MADAQPARPRRLTRIRRNPATAPIAVFVAGASAAVYLYGTDPHEGGQWLPQCPLRWTTGLLCPVCGGTRMVYDLMHGDVAAAWYDNRALFLVAPIGLAVLARWAFEGLRGRRWRPKWPLALQVLAASATLTWGVARNLV